MSESAMGEAMKAMRPRKKREPQYIRLCGCGAPMIWTFFFAYCQRYCLNCGNAGGMLGTGSNVIATPELKLKQKLIEAIWKILRDKMMPDGKFGRSGCKKDDAPYRYASSCDDHRAHLAPSEIEWDKLARPYLKKFQGIFDTKE